MPYISWLRMSMFASLWTCPHYACACMTHSLDSLSRLIRSLMFPSNEANKIDVGLVSLRIYGCKNLIRISPLYQFLSHNHNDVQFTHYTDATFIFQKVYRGQVVKIQILSIQICWIYPKDNLPCHQWRQRWHMYDACCFSLSLFCVIMLLL